MIRNALAKQLQSSLESIVGEQVPFPIIEPPKNPEYGQFASNICFGLSKVVRRAPKQIAEEVAEKLVLETDWNGVRIVPINGFLNFSFDPDLLWRKFLSYSPESVRPVERPRSILLEYVSANPTGPLHIGHGRWAVLGSAIASILRVVGHQVQTEFYVNDAGSQITNFRKSVDAVRAGNTVPENGYHGSYVKDLAKLDTDPVDQMRDRQKAVLESIHTRFDRWFSEKTLHVSGRVEAALNELRRRNKIYELDGAVWFRSTDYGDDKDRVLKKADGDYTYFAVDIAYHFDKLHRDIEFDRLINIWGADHHGYVARVKAAVKAVMASETEAPDDEKLTVIIGQLVSLLKGGEPVKMSKRTGEMVTLDEVIDEIGSDAVRFFLAQKSADTPIEFDIEVAKKQSNENPVYYVQYAHARISAVFRKWDLVPPSTAAYVTLNEAEKDLINWCLQFEDEMHAAATALAPHRLVNYLIELARRIHGMYETSPVGTASPDLQAQRLYLMESARRIIHYGLSILGISAPESM